MTLADDEREYLGEILTRRAKSLGKSIGNRIKLSELHRVRETLEMAQSPGYPISFDGKNVPVDVNEIVDRFPNLGKIGIDERFTNLDALNRLPHLKELGTGKLARGERIDLGELKALRTFYSQGAKFDQIGLT